MMRMGQHRRVPRERFFSWIEADTVGFVALVALVVLFFLFEGPKLFSGRGEEVHLCFGDRCHISGDGGR